MSTKLKSEILSTSTPTAPQTTATIQSVPVLLSTEPRSLSPNLLVYKPRASVSTDIQTRAKTQSPPSFSQSVPKCKYDNCMNPPLDSSSDYCDMHNSGTQQLKSTISICKSSGCTSVLTKATDAYCEDCIARTNVRLCKMTDCQNVASKKYSGYCKICFAQSVRHAKCKLNSCDAIVDRFQNDGYCGECFKSITSMRYCRADKCTGQATDSGYCDTCKTNLMLMIMKSQDAIRSQSNADLVCTIPTCNNSTKNGEPYCKECLRLMNVNALFGQCKTASCTGRAGENGYCESCSNTVLSQRPYRKVSLYNTCLTPNCIRLRKIEGYCDTCWQQAQSLVLCRSSSCRNQAKQDGYCSKCLAMLVNSQADTTTKNYYYYEKPKRCQSEMCCNLIQGNEIYCLTCCVRANSKSKIFNSRNETEIPIQIEKPRQPSINYVQDNNLTNHNYISVYQSDFKVPNKNLLVSDKSDKCSNCGSYVPTHQRNERLCGMCMQNFYIKNGQHYKSNGLLSKTRPTQL